MESRDRDSLRGLSLEDLRTASTSNEHPVQVVKNRSPLLARQLSLQNPPSTSPSPKTIDRPPSQRPSHALHAPTTPTKPSRPVLIPKTRTKHNAEIPTAVPLDTALLTPDMVREQAPPRGPLDPSRVNVPLPPNRTEKDKQEDVSYPSMIPQPGIPQFGKTTQLGSPAAPPRPASNISIPRAPTNPTADKYSHLFVSKGQKPEPYKPKSSHNLFHSLKGKVEQVEKKVNNYIEDKLEEYSHPSQHSVPNQYVQPAKPVHNNMFRPASQYSSQYMPSSSGAFSSNVNTNPYYRPAGPAASTTFNTGNSTNNNMFYQEGAAESDPFTYMDSAKANENIKALLEGAFEDEDNDKPRTRRKKKEQDAKLEDLASKMAGMKVEAEHKAEEDEEEEDEEDDGIVEGLKVTLLPHQIAGVEWMRDKELGTKKTRGVFPKGGILADDMGLGKTIQSIALILTNPKPTAEELEESKRKLTPGLDKCTLVVAPLALIKQWEGEIKDRVEKTHALTVCVHHGPKRAKSYKELRKYDIVITTYQTLASEHADSDGDLKVGCFGVKWYRIILDEAHSIKNRNAKATKAACALDSEYRWCLTGTPMQNNLDELQSLIHFLRIKPYDDLQVWREQITAPMNGGKGGLAIKRLRAYLQAFMKRRTKDVLKQAGGLKSSSKAGEDGKKTEFKIVKRTVEKIEADFTPEEREFYSRLESRADKSLEMMMAGNKISYASALVLLMRLRQACNHPKLTGSDLNAEKDSIASSGAQTPSRKKAAAVAEDMDSIADMLGGLSVQTKRCDMCQVDLTVEEAREGAIRCAACEVDLKDQVLVVKHKDKKKPKPHKKKPSQAKPLREKRRQARRIIDSDDEDDQAIDLTSASTTSSVNGDEDEDDLEDSDLYGSDSSDSSEIDLLASTKIRHLLRLLSSTAPTNKIIVFSFFTSMLDLIEPFLRSELPHLGYAKYYGSMRNDEREASLSSLRNDPKTRILLCSLRAGSLGLNLTAASRVVILEPFWNPFVEEQAIDRVHRLNQTQDVVVYKFTMKDTVEERILELQEKKRELANATIEGQKQGGMKLTLQDMLKLFRRDAEHEHGVDGIGMRDERGLVLRGEDVGGARGMGGGAGLGFGGRPGERKREHEVYGRRW